MSPPENRGRPVKLTPANVLEYLNEQTAQFLTADDVADRFDCSDQTARNKLEVLVEEGALSSVELGAGKPRLYFWPDYEAASQAIDVLRNQLDFESVDQDQLAAFADEPYCILPKAENEAWVICPRFVPFHVGWLDRQTDSYNVFVVNKYVDWIDELPEQIRQEVGISGKYDDPTVVDGRLEIIPENRAEAWEEFEKDRLDTAIPNDKKLKKIDYRELQRLAKAHDIRANQSADDLREQLASVRDDDTILLNPEREFDVIAKLIEDGNLPFRPHPVADDDLRPSPNNVDLRDYQERAWQKFLETGMVGVYWPPGAGKTFLALYAGERVVGQKLVVVPSSTLEQQWEERIEEYCAKPDEWEVRTYHYLRHGDNMEDYTGDEGPTLTVFDENHRLPANSFAKLATVDTNYRIGLSSSPYREDGRTEYIFALTGFPVGLDWQELVALGAVQTPDAKVLLYSESSEKWGDVSTLLSERTGKYVVFCDDIDAGSTLAQDLDVPFIHGETPKTKRMDLFRQNRVVVSSRVGDEGVSLPNLDGVIEVDFHGGSRRQEAQRYGRLMHGDGDNTGEHILMMTDEEYEKYGKRLMALEEQGIKISYERRS
jgi:DNA excision repair protein ERCC-3